MDFKPSLSAITYYMNDLLICRVSVINSAVLWVHKNVRKKYTSKTWTFIKWSWVFINWTRKGPPSTYKVVRCPLMPASSQLSVHLKKWEREQWYFGWVATIFPFLLVWQILLYFWIWPIKTSDISSGSKWIYVSNIDQTCVFSPVPVHYAAPKYHQISLQWVCHQYVLNQK